MNVEDDTNMWAPTEAAGLRPTEMSRHLIWLALMHVLGFMPQYGLWPRLQGLLRM